MKSKISIIMLLSLLLLAAIPALSASGTTRLKNYDLWRDLPTRQLMEMGADFFDAEKSDSALVCYNIVANRYQSGQEQDKYAAIAMNMLGVIYTHFYVDYEKAYSNLIHAEKIAQKNSFHLVLSDVYTNLGNIYITEAEFLNDGKLDDRVARTSVNAFNAAIETNKPIAIITTAFNLAHNAFNDSARFYTFIEEIDMFLKYPIPDSLRQHTFKKNYCLGVKEYYQKNYDKALSWFDKSLDNVYGSTQKERYLCYTEILSSKVQLLFELQRNQEAVQLLEELIRQGKENDDHHLLFFSYRTLSNFYHEIANDNVKGDKYELLEWREKNTVLGMNKLLDAEKVDFLFQIDEINAEAQELSHKHKVAKIIAWSIAALTLVILFFLYLLWRKYRQEQAKNRKLYENNLTLLALEEERRQHILEEENSKKYQSHQMDEDESSAFLHRILYIMETSDEVFQSSFSLDRLAELVDARSSKYVSQVLNDYYKHSFPMVLNEYRVREACRRINDIEQFGHLTVEAIAQSVGFKSYPNFVSNFKKFTGLTPSAYRKQAKTDA
ncbi:MAG: helix-turn-helix domain-containing protein [Muribaculaceae bacterium]|nr:helix-turn-helix domain-containing protein [Muribaculaceae bacterium]